MVRETMTSGKNWIFFNKWKNIKYCIKWKDYLNKHPDDNKPILNIVYIIICTAK